MNREQVKFILKKNARVIFFNKSSIYDEIESVKPYLNLFHAGYEAFAEAILKSITQNHEEALMDCRKSLEYGYQHNDTELIFEISMFMGIINRSIGRREEALNHYLTALKYENSPRCYNNIADIYLMYGDYKEARLYLIKAKKMLDEKSKLDVFEERLLNIIYTNLSEAELKGDELVAGLKSAQKCIEMADALEDVYIQASGHYLLGFGYSLQGDYDKALKHLDLSQQIYINCDTYAQSRVFDYIEENIRLEAEILNKWFKYEKSIDKLMTLRSLTKSDYQVLIANYEALDDQENVLKYYKRFMDYMKIEDAKETKNKIDYLKSKVHVHETEKKASNYQLLYNHTKSIAAMGRDIIAAEKLDDVLNALYSQVDKIMDFNSLALGIVEDDAIYYNWVIENQKKARPFSVKVFNRNSFSSWVVRNNKSIRINDALTDDEISKYKEDYAPTVYGHAMDAMVICPIAYKDKVYGLLNVQSQESYSYTDYDFEVLNMLASFIAIAMKNWQDTQSLKDLNEKLEILSKTDALTGISNRHVLSEIVEDIFTVSGDAHIEGDRCLIEVVGAMRPYLDDNGNRLFRYGGDEFAAIVPNLESNEVFKLLENVKNAIEDLKIINSKSLVSEYVTCSFGFTTAQKGAEYQKIFYMADEALYMAKASGKNSIKEKKEDVT
jgi:diguanylate cyclase (GGDEF)-like protein